MSPAPNTRPWPLNGTGGEVKLGGMLLTLESGLWRHDLGSAALMKTGAGLLELNGAATYDNQTIVNGGTLMVGGASAYSTRASAATSTWTAAASSAASAGSMAM